MKNILAAIAVLALAVSASAQQYETTSKTVTNLIAAVSTNSVTEAAYTITKNGEVAIQVSSKLTAAGTTSSKFVFSTGIDGTTYDGPQHTVSLTQAGTTTASVTSNINVGALGYIRLTSIGNGDDDGVLSNIVVKYTIKPNRLDRK